MAQAITATTSHRIALVTGGLDLGGTTTFLCNFAGELIRRNIPAEVFSLEHDNPLASDFARLKIAVHCDDERRFIFEDRLLSLFRRLAKFQPTAVIANLSASSFEVLRYLPPGVCRIGTVQNDDPDWYAMIRLYHAHLDLAAAVSETIKSRLEAMPEFARVPVAYVPYGVPMPENLEPGLADSQRPLRILYLGRLQRTQKRVHLFPAMLDQLKQSGIPFHWTIAGEGPERPVLEAAMKSEQPKQTVSFTGKVAYADVPALLARHDVYLLVSDYEGLPLSLLEAMGQGLVPVISDLPSGVRTVVNETTGIRVPLDQPTAYVEGMLRLHQHRDELRELSRNAREKVRQEFSIAAMTDRWLAAIPKPIVQPSPWPSKIKIRPILAATDPWRFSPLARFARRLAIKARRS